jgi:hypothetical protein
MTGRLWSIAARLYNTAWNIYHCIVLAFMENLPRYCLAWNMRQSSKGIGFMTEFKKYSWVLACLLISACASPAPTRIVGSGAGVAPPAGLAVLAADADGAPANSALTALAEKSLAARGYRLDPEGPYILDMAYGLRPGEIAVFAKPSAPALSPSQKKGFLSACKKQTHRLTLSVLERASGSSVYQGTAEEVHCQGKTTDSLERLLNALTADLAKPGGERVISSKR